jgi:hypothetical protein
VSISISGPSGFGLVYTIADCIFPNIFNLMCSP